MMNKARARAESSNMFFCVLSKRSFVRFFHLTRQPLSNFNRVTDKEKEGKELSERTNSDSSHRAIISSIACMRGRWKWKEFRLTLNQSCFRERGGGSWRRTQGLHFSTASSRPSLAPPSSQEGGPELICPVSTCQVGQAMGGGGVKGCRFHSPPPTSSA